MTLYFPNEEEKAVMEARESARIAHEQLHERLSRVAQLEQTMWKQGDDLVALRKQVELGNEEREAQGEAIAKLKRKVKKLKKRRR